MESEFDDKAKLIHRLEHDSGVLKKPQIKKAFENVDQADFVFGDYMVPHVLFHTVDVFTIVLQW